MLIVFRIIRLFSDMNMLQKRHGLLALALGAMLAASAPALAKSQGRPYNVDEIVRKTKAVYNSTSTAEISFEQSGAAGNISGTLTYGKGDKYRLELPKQTIISDGAKVWTYLPEKRQVLVSKSASGGSRLTPEDILTAFPGDYATELAGEQTVNGRKVWVVRCTPGRGEKIGDVTRAVLYIDKATYRFQQIEVESPTLGSMKIRIVAAQYGGKIPDSRFTFTAPQDVRVVDLTR